MVVARPVGGEATVAGTHDGLATPPAELGCLFVVGVAVGTHVLFKNVAVLANMADDVVAVFMNVYSGLTIGTNDFGFFEPGSR